MEGGICQKVFVENILCREGEKSRYEETCFISRIHFHLAHLVLIESDAFLKGDQLPPPLAKADIAVCLKQAPSP